MISVWGTYLGTSGYAKHTSNLASELAKITEVRMHSNNGLPVNLSQYHSENISDNLVSIAMPPYWDIFSGSRIKNFSGFLVFEADDIPQYWADILQKEYVKRVLVPSNHVKKITERHTTKPVYVIPHGYDPKIFYPKPREPDASHLFTFGFVGGWAQGKNDRKGFDILLETFCDTFDNKDNVRLLAKLNMAYQHPQKVMNDLNLLNLPEKEKRPKIDLILDNYTDSQMNDYYNSLDVIAFPTRGEAFNIPGIESLACKIPNIVTGWGGQMDYINKDNSWIVDYMMKDYSGNDHLYENLKLAEPKVEDLKRCLKEAYEKRDLVRDKADSIDVSNWTWANSAKKLKEIAE